MERPIVNVKCKKMNPDAKMPMYAEDGAAGFDLHCVHSTVIKPGQIVLIDTGLAFEVPLNYFIELREKSGIAVNTSLILKAGIIDPTYRDSVKVVFYNTSDNRTVIFEKGQKIVQGIVRTNYKADFEEVETLSETQRGVGGFGHTGK